MTTIPETALTEQILVTVSAQDGRRVADALDRHGIPVAMHRLPGRTVQAFLDGGEFGLFTAAQHAEAARELALEVLYGKQDRAGLTAAAAIAPAVSVLVLVAVLAAAALIAWAL